jgi:hypothetical protein
LTYGSRKKGMTWNADLGYQNQVYNWYGLHPSFFDDATINTIDEQQTYHTLYLGGRLGLDTILKESSVRFSRFWDAFGSAENRFVAKPSLEFDIVEQKIRTDFVLDYISGSFDQTYSGGSSYKYGFTNIGFQPSIKINKGDLSMNVGAGFCYSAAQGDGESKFFIYPQVTGSYKVVGDLMIFYAGLEGTLQQNSYHDFVQQNFFVSPTLGVAPTDQKYDVYAGLKGKLANNIAYNVRGSYLNEKKCPQCGSKDLSEPRQFNLMFKTHMGPVEDSGSVIYLRPETAQGHFVNFQNCQQSSTVLFGACLTFVHPYYSYTTPLLLKLVGF